MDNLLKTGLKVIFPLMLGRSVVCDRYTLDLMVETMADLHDSSQRMRFGYKLLRLLPRPDCAFLIDIDPNVAFKRKPDMPTLSHFVERVRLYRELGPILGIRVLNGNRPLERVHDEIWGEVSLLAS